MVEIGKVEGSLGAYWVWRVEDFPAATVEAYCIACGHAWDFDLARHAPQEHMVTIARHARCPHCKARGVDFKRPQWDVDRSLQMDLAAAAARRTTFPAPWRMVEHGESFSIEDAKGQHLAFVYFENETSRRNVMSRLTRDEARRIAANIARLPDLLTAAKER